MKLRVSQARTLCTPELEWLWGSLNNRRRPGRFAWGRMSEARIMDSRLIPRFSPTLYKLRLKHRRQLLRSDIGTWRKGWIVRAHWAALPRASQGLSFLTAWQSQSTRTSDMAAGSPQSKHFKRDAATSLEPDRGITSAILHGQRILGTEPGVRGGDRNVSS